MELVGNSAIVTGGAAGIGLAIARRLLAEGASVLLLDINGEGVHATARSLAGEYGEDRVVAHVGSATELADIEAAFDAATDRFGTVQLLANNAGAGGLNHIVDTPVEEWDFVFEGCVKSVFLGTRVFGQRAIQAGVEGAILNTSSLTYMAATEGFGHYCAAKAAVSQFTKVAALELAPHGIRANAVAPGLTRVANLPDGYIEGRTGTDFVARIPLGRPGEPEEVASVAAFLFSRDAGWVTGVTLNVDGGNHIRGMHNYWAAVNEA